MPHEPDRHSPAELRPVASTRPSGAARFLRSGERDDRRDSRRIAVGLGALVLVALIAIHAGVYHDARQRLTERGWQRLLTNAEIRRDQVATLVQAFAREARSVAESPDVRALGSRMAAGDALPADELELLRELERSRALFDFAGIRLLDENGRARLATRNAPAADAATQSELVRRAIQERRSILGDPRGPWLSVAVPVRSNSGVAMVLLVHAESERWLLPALREWPGFGASAGACLVRAEGDELIVLTPPTSPCDPPAGSRLPRKSPENRVIATTAAGREVRTEAPDAHGHATWTVTRQVPGTEWGFVARVERDEMLRDLRVTVAGLLLFDLALLAALFAMAWWWQRNMRGRLAEHERQVTERHARRVQAILDTAFDAILTFDADGRVISANRAAEELFGAPSAELERRTFGELLGSPESASEPPRTGTMRAVARRADGGTTPVEASLGRADDGASELFTAIVRDIRDRVQAEARVQAFASGLEVTNRRLEEVNTQLEEASRLKSEFLANTSHELRTPLNGMIGFLQLVLDGLCDSPEEERDFLQQALQCSRHLLGLINDVLDIARIESGKLTFEVTPVEIPALFDEVNALLRVQAAQKGLRLEFVDETAGTLRVRGDFAKAKQVLINLVGNSLKFTPEGGITVRARSRGEIGHVIFDVVDTGIGIPRDRQRVIFEKFVQADGSTTRRYGGTGLGLAITKSLVELMGGILGVQSDGEGRGTRMYFSLPVWRESEAIGQGSSAPEANDEICGDGDGGVVLVVEDDSVFRRFLVAVLQQHGWRTLEAANAERGWTLACRHRPAAVLLDYALTCGDDVSLRTGWDLARRMTQDPRTRHVPVVFVTGFDDEVVERIRETAFARKPEHLLKPVTAESLVAKLEALTAGVEGRAAHLLVADDDPSVHAYVRKVLPTSRWHVEFAHDGEECLHLLRTRGTSFDALVLDLMMPRVSGYDVLREITLSGAGARLPVIVLTNFAEPRTAEEARLLEDGIVLDVISKTDVHGRPGRLAELLETHLRAHRPDGESGIEEAA